MPKFYTYPHVNIRVIDQSAKTPYVPEEIPLHRPLFVSVAQKGKGMGYGTYELLSEKYGEGTFDQHSKYFKHQNFFLRTACQAQPVFFYRLIPDDAKEASVVLEAHVKDDDILKWQRDSDGKYLLDSDGNKIPVLDHGPSITNIMWSNLEQVESTSYDLTIEATEPDGLSMTYQLVCDDSNVIISQDAVDPNIFHITYPDYLTAETQVNFVVTVTASDGDTITASMKQVVNRDPHGPIYGFWWSDINHNASGYYNFRVNITSACQSYNLSSNDPNVTITQDGTDPTIFHITYGQDFLTAHSGDTFPINVLFAFSAVNDEGTTMTTTSSFNVSENTSDNQITSPGVTIEWRTRPLASNETIKTLSTSTYLDNGITVTVYPVLAFTPNLGPGEYGNNIGFSLFVDPESDTDTINDNEARMFSIGFYDKPYGYDTPTHVRNFYGQVYNEFMFYPDGIYKAADMRLDFGSVIYSAFRDNFILDYHVYTDNVKTIGERVQAAEAGESNGITELTTPWMANIIDAKDTNGVPYYRTEIVIDGLSSELMQKDVIHYCSGGDDGDISDANFEAMAGKFFSGDTFPEIKDYRKWPCNHIYDSGFKLDTKYQMFKMMSIRDDIHVIVATQDVSQDPYDKMTDQSAGSALRVKALLYPESSIDGTQACRVTIFMQSCLINFDDRYTRLVPMSFFALLARSTHHNTTFIKSEWKGLPNSSCDFIKWINWAPYDPDVKQLFWDTALNYCQYYDMTRLHYPDIISVYPLQTSLLSSDLFVTYVIYLKQLVRSLWSKYAGVEEPTSTLKSLIEKDLNNEIYDIFHSYIKVVPNVYETDLDKQLGYSLTVELAVYDSVAKRVWNVPIYVRRIEDLQTT